MEVGLGRLFFFCRMGIGFWIYSFCSWGVFGELCFGL